MRMTALRPGQRAIIRGFRRSAMDRSYCKQLLSMGLLPNTEVCLIGRAPFGDPLEFQVGERRLCLRAAECQALEVALIEDV